MKKSDLRTGMVVKLRNGKPFVVMNGTSAGDILILDIEIDQCCISEDETITYNLESWTNDIEHECNCNLDIVVVRGSDDTKYQACRCQPIIWQEPEQETEPTKDHYCCIGSSRGYTIPLDFELTEEQHDKAVAFLKGMLA